MHHDRLDPYNLTLNPGYSIVCRRVPQNRIFRSASLLKNNPFLSTIDTFIRSTPKT